jgi:hypothetical protein
MICVFGHRSASEADRVVRALRDTGSDVVRVNTGAGEAQVALRVGVGGTGTTAVARCDGREVDVRLISAAWLHQLPPLDQPEHPVLPTEAAVSSRVNVWEAFMGTIPEKSWLNPPWRVRAAANKFVQLSTAFEVGLGVAPTIIGDDPREIRALAHARTVMKYFGDSARLWASGSGMAALTVESDIASTSDHDLSYVPLMHQIRLDAQREYRVVAVGSDRFVAACDKPAGLTDIRNRPGLPTYQVDTLPEHVDAALSRLLQRLNLEFCSADFAVSRDDEWTFLDLNATGAFWWVDDLYDRAVTSAIARRLLGATAM